MKKTIIAIFLMNALSFAHNIPLNFSVGLSSGYNRYNISEKEFEKYGFSKINNKKYSKNSLVNSLSLEVDYKFKFEKFKVVTGVGASVFIENQLVKALEVPNKKGNEKEVTFANALAELKTLEEKKEEVESRISDVSYPKIVAQNREYSLTKKIAKLKKDNKNIDRDIKKITDKMNEVPQDKIPELEQKFDELEKTADRNDDIEREKIKKIAEYEKELKKTDISDEERQRITTEKETAKREKEAAHNARIEALKERQTIFNTLELIKDGDKKKEKKAAQKTENEEAIKKAEKDVEEYKEAKKALKREEREIITERDEIEKSQNESKDKYRTEIYKLESAYNSEYEDYEFPEDEEDVTEKLKKDYNDILVQKDNEYAKELLAYNLSKNYDFGGSIYSKVGIEKDLTKNLSIFSNTRLGVTLSEHPLFKAAIDLESKNVKIDGKQYLRPRQTKNVKVNVKFDASIGIKYYGFITEAYVGYGNGIAGLKLGYEF